MVTNGTESQNARSRKGGKAGPHTIVKFGSAAVPIYLSASNGRTRFILCGRSARRAANPTVAAVADYVQARKLAESESLTSMAKDYRRVFKPLTRRTSVGQLVEELLVARKQDGASRSYVSQIKTVLTRFAEAFPGEILGITSSDIDAWLRGLEVSASSRNGMLICVKVLFSYARSQNCLPAEQMTAAEQLKKVKLKNDDVAVFTPEEMAKILHAAPPHLVPILAIGAFSGIRMAELNPLDWSAVDLERGHIELRASQAKTASRRIIPITDNLRAWIEALPRKGKVVRTALLHREVTALTRALKLEWPRNLLRHSFISYRIAKVKSADQVALEAGNSAAIIFKPSRELATETEADAWFGILPKPSQWENHHTLVVEAEERPMDSSEGACSWAILTPDDRSVVAPYARGPGGIRSHHTLVVDAEAWPMVSAEGAIHARSFRPTTGVSSLLTHADQARSTKRQTLRKVEAIQVHHLVPGRNEIVDELLLPIRTAVNFSQGAELGV